MKNICGLLVLLALFSIPVLAEEPVTITASVTEGSLFPYLYAQSVEDKYVSLPYEVTSKAQISLIILTFARPNDDDMNSWVKPFAEKYENNTRTAYYKIALVGDVGFINGFIYNDLRDSVTTELRKHLLVYFHDKEPYKTMFGVTDSSLIYNCLVDQNGVIKMIKAGKRADQNDIDAIIAATESLLNPPKTVKNKQKSKIR